MKWVPNSTFLICIIALCLRQPHRPLLPFGWSPHSLQTVLTLLFCHRDSICLWSPPPTSVRTSFSSLSVPPFQDLHTLTFKPRLQQKTCPLYVSASSLITKQNGLSLDPFLWVHSSDLILVSLLTLHVILQVFKVSLNVREHPGVPL